MKLLIISLFACSTLLAPAILRADTESCECECEKSDEDRERVSRKIRRFYSFDDYECWSGGCEQAAIENKRRGDWFYLALTLRGGLTRPDGEFVENLGAEAGLALPYGNGVDIGSGFGSVFKKGAEITNGWKMRVFLHKFRRGLYLGGTYVPVDTTKSYGILGYSFHSLYAELDFLRGGEAPITVLPEFGLRVRF